MPSTSAKQHRFMAAIAHSPSFAKKVGVSQSVGKDFNAADKGKTFKRGGDVKKFTNGGLPDSETRMVPYGKLSGNRQAEIKSQYEKDAKEARANVKRPFGSKVLDAYYEINPLVSEKQRQSVRSDATEDVAQRQRKLDYAEGRLKGLGTRKEYFSDDAPHKIDLNEKLFNKGGMMKESKAMVGKEMAFMKKKGAPASMMKHEKAEMMGMKKGGMPMKDGKPAFMQKKMMGGGMAKYAKGGSIRRMADGGMTAPMAPPMPPQAPVDPRQMAAMQAAMQAQGGAPMPPPAPGMKRGGSVRFAKGGGIESRGKTKGTIIRMASGGSVSSASRRADGIAQRGKTRC